MAGPDFLSQLPSLEELLEQPRVKAAIERLNQSTAATRVRTALNGLGAEVSRRAEELQSMAPADLLDKLVRKISEPTPPVASEQINATGRLFVAPWVGPPLPAVAIEAAQAAAAGFRSTEPRRAAQAATQVLGCESAALFSSQVVGLGVTLETLAGGGAVVVARGEMSQIAMGVRLDGICRRAGATLHEVGATDAATLADYEGAINAAKAAGHQRIVVLKRLVESEDASDEVPLEELVALSQRSGVLCLVDARYARPRSDTPAYGSPIASVQNVFDAGAEAALVNAGGRIGGPLGALLVGKRSFVRTVETSEVAMTDSVDPITDAGLAATLALFEHPETLRFTHPLYQLLDTPLENLKSRAERLAPQIAAGEGVQSVEPELVEATKWAGATWRLRVQPERDLRSLQQAMTADQSPSVAYNMDEESVCLDLRTVFPGQDRLLASVFGSQLDADEGDPS